MPRLWSEAGDDRPVYLVVIDNLRLDQWKMIEPLLLNRFRVAHNETYFSMLPTATQYARNALFAGLSPAEIARVYPQYWIGEDEEGSKNKFEGELFQALLKRMNSAANPRTTKSPTSRQARKWWTSFTKHTVIN